MKQKFTLTIISLVIVALTISCNKDADQLKIGMFVVGDGYNDSGYKQNCKQGLLQALEENLFDTLFISSLTHTQDEINYFPLNGCDALFLAGSLATDQILVAAGSYPKTQFVIVDYTYEGPLLNVQSICYNIDEAAFPLGFFAAFWASHKDGANPVVALIGGMDIPPVERFIKAYELGVTYFNNKYNLKVNTVISFLNSFDNSDYGYHIADSLITVSSADVIIPVAGAAGNGALYAAKANNKWAIGVDADQFYSLPDLSSILLSSCVKSLENTVYNVASTFIANPIMNNTTYTGTLKNQGVSLAPFHNFETQIPDSIKTEIEAIKSGIIAGTINTGFSF